MNRDIRDFQEYSHKVFDDLYKEQIASLEKHFKEMAKTKDFNPVDLFRIVFEQCSIFSTKYANTLLENLLFDAK